MWLNVAGLVLLLGLVLFALEVLHALFHCVIKGQAADVVHDRAVHARQMMEGTLPLPGDAGLVRQFLSVLRWILHFLVVVGGGVSLALHEVFHASVHVAMGARPTIVLLKNGGYATPRPWPVIGGIPLVFTYPLLGGVLAIAPVLGGSALYLALLLWTTPLATADVLAQARAIADACAPADLARLPGTVADVAGGAAGALWHGGWVAWLLFLVVLCATSMCLTPSSMDFAVGWPNLVGNAIAAVVAAALLGALPNAGPWILLGPGIPLFIWYGNLTEERPRLERAVGACSLTLVAIAVLAWSGALGADAPRGIAVGIALAVAVLVLAFAILLAFLLLVLALNLAALELGAFPSMVRAVPEQLRLVFSRFHTCRRCRLHFYVTCEGCGRTPEEIAAVGNRVSPTEFLEQQDPKTGYLFAKVRGGFREVGALRRAPGVADYKRIMKLVKKGEIRGSYIDIRNHSDERDWLPTIPSGPDLRSIFHDPLKRGAIVAQHDRGTGKVEGYYLVRKTRNTPGLPSYKTEDMSHLLDATLLSSLGYPHEAKERKAHEIRKAYRRDPRIRKLDTDLKRIPVHEHGGKQAKGNHSPTLIAFERFCQDYRLQFRAVPTKGFHFDRKRVRFVKDDTSEGRLQGVGGQPPGA